MSRLAFPKTYHLIRRSQFEACYSRGRRYFTSHFILFVHHREDNGPWRLGLAVSKKVGNSVQRNRIKRVVREFFRLHQDRIPSGIDYVVIPKRNVRAFALVYGQVEKELGTLISSQLSGRVFPSAPDGL
ncbi:ribonuclease P protein component [Desulfoplanes sp. PS50]